MSTQTTVVTRHPWWHYLLFGIAILVVLALVGGGILWACNRKASTTTEETRWIPKTQSTTAAAPTAVGQNCCPTPTPAVVAPAAVVDCGPWSLEGNVLVWRGNSQQDVCQKGNDLAAIRAGTTSRFSRASSFTLAICSARVTNKAGGIWNFADCDQATNVFPAGDYTVEQPANYSNGGYRASNR